MERSCKAEQLEDPKPIAFCRLFIEDIHGAEANSFGALEHVDLSDS